MTARVRVHELRAIHIVPDEWDYLLKFIMVRFTAQSLVDYVIAYRFPR